MVFGEGSTRFVLPYRYVPDSYLWDSSTAKPVLVADGLVWSTLDTIDRLFRLDAEGQNAGGRRE